MNDLKNEISLREIFKYLLGSKKSLLILISSCLLLSIALNLFLPKKYIAEISITQSSSNSSPGLGNVSSIASSFGINLNNLNGDIFYLPNLINSNSLKKHVILKERLINNDFTSLNEHYNQPIFAFNILSIDEKLSNSLEIFSNNLSILEDQNSGMITIQFMSNSTDLSKDVLEDIKNYLNDYLNSDTNNQASSMLDLINNELDITRLELNNAEDNLASFVDQNRSYFDSPSLVVQYSRLERDVLILNEKYKNLVVQQTMAMIEEKKQLPQLNIISEPFGNPNHYKPNILNIFIVVFILFFSFYISFILYKSSPKN